LGDPDRGLMKDDVDVVHQACNQSGVADVAFHHADRPGGERLPEVASTAANEVVENDDLLGAGLDEFVDDMRADRAGAAGDERTLTT
jgi:hypothetical protein